MNFYALAAIIFALSALALGIYQITNASSQFNIPHCETKQIDNSTPTSFLMNGIFIVITAIIIIFSEYSHVMQ